MKQLLVVTLFAFLVSCNKNDLKPTSIEEANANKSALLVSKQYVNGILQREYKYKDRFLIYKKDENATYNYTYDISKLQTILTLSVGFTNPYVHQFDGKGRLLFTDQYRNNVAYLRRVRFYENNTCTGWMNIPIPGYALNKSRTDYIYTTPWEYYTQVTDYNSDGNPMATGIDEIFKWPTPFILEYYSNKNVLINREYFSSNIRRPDYNILNNPKPWPIETHEPMSRLRYERSEVHPDSRPGLLVMKTEYFSGGILSSISTVENLELNEFGLPVRYDLVNRRPDGQINGKSTYQFDYISY